MSNQSKIHSLALYIISLWLGIGLWLTHRGEKTLLFLSVSLCLIVIVSYIQDKRALTQFKSHFTRHKANLIFIMPIVVYHLMDFISGGVPEEAKRASISLACFSLIYFNLINIEKIKRVTLAIILVHACYIFYITQITGKVRPDEILNPNHYAPFLGLVFSYYCFTFYNDIKNKHNVMISVIGLALSLYCVSQMRSIGVYLASLAILILLFTSLVLFSRNKLRIFAIIFVSLVIISFTLSNQLNYAYEKTTHQVESIVDKNYASSWGQRVAMLNIGKEIIKEHFVIGVGDDFKMIRNNIAKDNDYPFVNLYDSLHNLFIQEFAQFGIIGLFWSLFLVSMPAILFYRTAYFKLGLTFSIYVAIISCVDVALRQGVFLSFYLMSLLILYRAAVCEHEDSIS